MPIAWSTAIEPVEIASSASVSRWPRRMIAPLPNCRSIWESVPSMAFSRSNFGSAINFFRSLGPGGTESPLYCAFLGSEGMAGMAPCSGLGTPILEDVNEAVNLQEPLPRKRGARDRGYIIPGVDSYEAFAIICSLKRTPLYLRRLHTMESIAVETTNPSLAAEPIRRLEDNVARVIRGKREVIRLTTVCLLARGHVLLEDVPGVGKTTLAQAFARSLGLEFQRIQFTSDLLPSDIIGVSIFNQKTQSFEFVPGPLFANVVLADEINRATPKTQSALLEAMSERRVSVERKRFTLPEPFTVLATQNPLEYQGTFPLPESQLDRFMMSLSLGYPPRADERELLLSGGVEAALDQ